MKIKPKHKKTLIWTVGIAAVVLLLLIVVNAIVAYIFIKPKLVAYLKQSVYTATDSLYTLEFEEINIDLIRGRVKIKNLHLKPDTALYGAMFRNGDDMGMLYEMESDKLLVSGIELLTFFRKKHLNIELIEVERPEIHIRKYYSANDTLSKPASFDPYELIAPVMKKLSVERIRIDNGHLLLERNRKDKKLKLDFKRFYIDVDSLYIDSLSKNDTTSQFYSDDFRLTVNDFDYKLADSLYILHLGSVGLSSKQSELHIENLWLEPRYGKRELHKVLGKEMDHIELKVASIRAEGFDMKGFLREEVFIADKITVSNASLVDFLYNFKVDHKPFKALPYVALKKLPMRIGINTLLIKNSEVVYLEQPAGQTETGKITFSNLNASISNITNLPGRQAGLSAGQAGLPAGASQQAISHADVEADFMNIGRLEVDFDFHLNRNDGYFTVNGSLGRMPMEPINDMLEAAARLKVKRGTIQKLLFSFSADNTQSNGEMRFYYNNLSIELLGKEDSEKNMKIASLLTNLLVLKSDNPRPNEPLSVGKISFVRNQHKSVFHYLWKSLLSGFKGSVGITKEKEDELRGMAQKFKNMKENRLERKEKRIQRREERKAEK